MQQLRHILILALTASLMIFSSCNKGEDPSILYNLEDEFSLRPIENITGDIKNPALVFTSVNPKPCENSEIQYQYRVVDGISLIQIIDIVEPQDCQSAIEYPDVNIPLISGSRVLRKITIKIKDVVENTGELWDNGDHYELILNNTDGLSISHDILHKMPENSFWGGVDFANTDHENIANQFVSEVTALGEINLHPAGYYGHFNVEDNHKIQIFIPQKRGYRQAFLIKSQTVLSEFQYLIDQYRTNNPHGIDFHIHTSQGVQL